MTLREFGSFVLDRLPVFVIRVSLLNAFYLAHVHGAYR